MRPFDRLRRTRSTRPRSGQRLVRPSTLRSRVEVTFGLLALAISALLSVVSWVVVSRYLLSQREDTAVTETALDRSSVLEVLGHGTTSVAAILDQLRGDAYVRCLRECAEILDREVEVDYTRARPIAKVTGEFWAQTTEGDGNFRMFPFLEAQGAEVLVEPVTTWINYMLVQVLNQMQDEYGLESERKPLKRVLGLVGYHKKRFHLRLAQRLLLREYDRYRAALGGTTHAQVDQLHRTALLGQRFGGLHGFERHVRAGNHGDVFALADAARAVERLDRHDLRHVAGGVVHPAVLDENHRVLVGD